MPARRPSPINLPMANKAEAVGKHGRVQPGLFLHESTILKALGRIWVDRSGRIPEQMAYY